MVELGEQPFGAHSLPHRGLQAVHHGGVGMSVHGLGERLDEHHRLAACVGLASFHRHRLLDVHEHLVEKHEHRSVPEHLPQRLTAWRSTGAVVLGHEVVSAELRSKLAPQGAGFDAASRHGTERVEFLTGKHRHLNRSWVGEIREVRN
jgi:hypothetical protein